VEATDPADRSLPRRVGWSLYKNSRASIKKLTFIFSPIWINVYYREDYQWLLLKREDLVLREEWWCHGKNGKEEAGNRSLKFEDERLLQSTLDLKLKHHFLRSFVCDFILKLQITRRAACEADRYGQLGVQPVQYGKPEWSTAQSSITKIARLFTFCNVHTHAFFFFFKSTGN
jgi:hypothetical protein